MSQIEIIKNPKALISKEEILKKVQEIAKQITEDYQGKRLTAICVLKGGIIFFSDIVREIELPLTCEFLAVSSYGNEKKSSGEVQMIMDVKYPLEGKDVIIFEDIVDTGLTLNYLVNLFKARNPASLKVCSLLFKPDSLKGDIKPDYYGFEIGNEFVVGYGLDYAGYYRDLPYIGLLK